MELEGQNTYQISSFGKKLTKINTIYMVNVFTRQHMVKKLYFEQT